MLSDPSFFPPFLLPTVWNSDVMAGPPVTTLDAEITLGMGSTQQGRAEKQEEPRWNHLNSPG